MKVQRGQKPLALLMALSACVAVLAACGASNHSAETPEPPLGATDSPAETPPEEEVAAEAQKKFDEMSAPEKMQHMKTVVAPGMAKVFQEDGAEQYAKFSCATCHGSGVKRGNFAMPSADLPALDDAVEAAHPEVTKFMKERVVPEMAKMLGEKPYSAESPSGFGCFGCHTKKE